MLDILMQILLFKVLIDCLLWHIVEKIIIRLLEMYEQNIIYQKLI